MMDAPQGPGERGPGPDPGNPIMELGFKYLENVYLEPAKIAWNAIRGYDNITARQIINEILLNTNRIQHSEDQQDQHDLCNEYKTPEMKVAIVYGFLLTKIIPPEEEAKITELQTIQEEVFSGAGYRIDGHARECFQWIIRRDTHRHPLKPALGPGRTIEAKLLETISRIVDHVYIK